MKLLSPIYVLKSQAKQLKKSQCISMSQALDLVAKEEGFNSWSLLMAKRDDVYPDKYQQVLDFFNHGDLVLIGARPGMGKTSFTYGLFMQAIAERNCPGFWFNLSEHNASVRKRMAIYNQRVSEDTDLCWLDDSNNICAQYIISVTREKIKPGAMIVVDYLQLLDERRINPPLQEQVQQLKQFAKESGCIIIFICQIDREINQRENQRPTTADIRLPNPLDLGLLNKTMFIYRESSKASEAEVIFTGRTNHSFKLGLDLSQPRFFDL